MISVLVAGIGGGSLGAEVAKSLRKAGGYRVIGCDISPLAFGHYAELCHITALVSVEGYVDLVLEVCRKHDVRVVIPGADQPTALIAAAADGFAREGIRLAMNAPQVVATLVDKQRCFLELERLGFMTPRTVAVTQAAALDKLGMPCVIKPSTDSGGSSFVFFANDRMEAELYATYLVNNGKSPIAQEYVSHEHGEYSVGVLCEPDGSFAGVIAMQRAFPAKLSIMARGRDFLISSGISQGRFGEYPDVCATARDIALALKSTGPLNIQGRVDKRGHFLPFEINPRFSATTYLRALAGFNEVDHYVRRLLDLPTEPLTVRSGWYLRGLTEVVVPDDGIIK